MMSICVFGKPHSVGGYKMAFPLVLIVFRWIKSLYHYSLTTSRITWCRITHYSRTCLHSLAALSEKFVEWHDRRRAGIAMDPGSPNLTSPKTLGLTLLFRSFYDSSISNFKSMGKADWIPLRGRTNLSDTKNLYINIPKAPSTSCRLKKRVDELI